MPKRILLLGDIHANFPALAAIDRHAEAAGFDLILNSGDSTVFAPFPNETLDWLREHRVVSILGNTDRKVLKLLRGKSLDKPKKTEKRIMYTWTAEQLTPENRLYLASFTTRKLLAIEGWRLGLFHGSPDDDDEFLFPDTPEERFRELVAKSGSDIVIIGHSHTPFHKKIGKVHFINPGSVGRMFDGNPDTSFATLELSPGRVRVELHRCPYPVDEIVAGLRSNRLPALYEEMYRTGRKLN
ncbi:MAG TPA: metallophosphoesterase [Desulfobulbaceae bacterium]|nr:metallophosphoesterase [Desulfobulbaceae bacterium]